MTIPATDTAIDVAYWFFNRAEKDGLYLETDVMQHLLFLAQVHFAMSYNMQMLTPSLFVCDHTGFYEPNLIKLKYFLKVFGLSMENFLYVAWKKSLNLIQLLRKCVFQEP